MSIKYCHHALRGVAARSRRRPVLDDGAARRRVSLSLLPPSIPACARARDDVHHSLAGDRWAMSYCVVFVISGKLKRGAGRQK